MNRLLSLLFACSFCVASWATDFVYHSLEGMPVLGTAAPDASKAYSRLPDSLLSRIRQDLWDLGQHSAGLSIRFRSDASDIAAKWHSLNRFNMNHMTPTGIRGMDLYTLAGDSAWTFVGSCRPYLSSSSNRCTVIENMEPRMREYMLFLSLYDGIDSIYIGTDSAAVVEAPAVPFPVRERPVMMYGTSILQGGCATRPGMAHTNILQRMLNREVYNLGFSGNARLDLEIADVMASVPASVYVLDMLSNVTQEQLMERIDPFYQRLRASHPDAPILLVENPQFPSMRFNTEQRQAILDENAWLRQWYEQHKQSDPNLYYFESANVLCGDVEATVDNAHFTDTGFATFARSLAPVLREIIER